MKPEHLNLPYLKYFIDTVETQSFSAAATLNHVSRPAISQGVKRLEDWAGLNLLIHKKNSFELTKDGETFYRRSKSAFEAFKDSLQGYGIQNNLLKLGCSFSLVDSFLIPTLKKMNPTPKIELKSGPSYQLKHLLEEGIINAAIFIDHQVLPGFESAVLYEGKFGLFSIDGKMKDILIVTEDRPEVIKLKHYLYESGITPQIIQAESWGLALKLANALNGSCLLPDLLTKDTTLKKNHLKEYKESYRVTLVTRRSEQLSDAEFKFCEIIKKLRI